MGIMVYSLLWVLQDFDHQPYDRTLQYLFLRGPYDTLIVPLQKNPWGVMDPDSLVPSSL